MLNSQFPFSSESVIAMTGVHSTARENMHVWHVSTCFQVIKLINHFPRTLWATCKNDRTTTRSGVCSILRWKKTNLHQSVLEMVYRKLSSIVQSVLGSYRYFFSFYVSLLTISLLRCYKLLFIPSLIEAMRQPRRHFLFSALLLIAHLILTSVLPVKKHNKNSIV